MKFHMEQAAAYLDEYAEILEGCFGNDTQDAHYAAEVVTLRRLSKLLRHESMSNGVVLSRKRLAARSAREVTIVSTRSPTGTSSCKQAGALE